MPMMIFKGVFFSENAIRFSILQISKKIFQKTILQLKFKFLANDSKVLLAGNLNFKLRIVFFEIWRSKKRIALSGKKATLQVLTDVNPLFSQSTER